MGLAFAKTYHKPIRVTITSNALSAIARYDALEPECAEESWLLYGAGKYKSALAFHNSNEVFCRH